MATHSPEYEKVKSHYDNNSWSMTSVRNAVKAHWITAKEFEEITGEKYED